MRQRPHHDRQHTANHTHREGVAHDLRLELAVGCLQLRVQAPQVPQDGREVVQKGVASRRDLRRLLLWLSTSRPFLLARSLLALPPLLAVPSLLLPRYEERGAQGPARLQPLQRVGVAQGLQRPEVRGLRDRKGAVLGQDRPAGDGVWAGPWECAERHGIPGQGSAGDQAPAHHAAMGGGSRLQRGAQAQQRWSCWQGGG